MKAAKMAPIQHGTLPANVINGILVEGVDYSGKTTVARHLLTYFADAGRMARYGKEFLTEAPEVLHAVKTADALMFGFEQDIVFAEATILDIRSYCHEDVFLVQDRHWMSIFGHLTFFYGDRAALIYDILRKEHFQFRYQVYLTSTLEAKKARIEACPPRSPLDTMLAKDPILHQHYDEHIMRLLPPSEPWLIIDTAMVTAAEVVARIIGSLGL